ncbi:hypothetical protein BDV25DRAFT_138598 [Aspergillus avenaceus]|uniref:Uncharacterized protein n=1 Tax=Aspergillus avenaceus TaxID=36643 RepID=A0A5N6TZD2_ASPAV|nr:hypothetical protein BDV25DRAFT_138598 [Aspergillus avenaceus]
MENNNAKPDILLADVIISPIYDTSDTCNPYGTWVQLWAIDENSGREDTHATWVQPDTGHAQVLGSMNIEHMRITLLAADPSDIANLFCIWKKVIEFVNFMDGATIGALVIRLEETDGQDWWDGLNVNFTVPFRAGRELVPRDDEIVILPLFYLPVTTTILIEAHSEGLQNAILNSRYIHLAIQQQSSPILEPSPILGIYYIRIWYIMYHELWSHSQSYTGRLMRRDILRGWFDSGPACASRFERQIEYFVLRSPVTLIEQENVLGVFDSMHRVMVELYHYASWRQYAHRIMRIWEQYRSRNPNLPAVPRGLRSIMQVIVGDPDFCDPEFWNTAFPDGIPSIYDPQLALIRQHLFDREGSAYTEYVGRCRYIARFHNLVSHWWSQMPDQDVLMEDAA